MDAKDLRTGSALSERSNDGNKYAQSGTLQCNKNKSYHDVGSNSLVKVDTPNGRPCAVIGPDRVLPPPQDPSVTYMKKASVEPWPCQENTYQRPPEYLQKIATYQNPARNISPRQTFQENMQRIMVAPTYNTVKVNNESTYYHLPDKNIPSMNTSKMSISSDNNYCDVPYTVIPTNNDSKSIKNVDICAPTVNPNLTRSTPQGWQPNAINVHPQRPYATSDMYPYPEYPSCAGPRHVPHTHRTIPEEPGYMYPEAYYQESNIRFKPYLNLKERYQPTRYDYINNYSNPFHPPPFPPNKYELPKTISAHSYPGFPHLKYAESRLPEPILDGYQRPINQQSNYNMQYRNPVIHPVYGPITPNCLQGKIPSFPPDGSSKSISSNKLSYDNSKMYVNYEHSRIKPYPSTSDNFYVNEASRMHAMKNQGIISNYSPMIQAISPHSHYKKDNSVLKSYEHTSNYKNVNQSIHFNSPVSRHLPQFSPSTLAISPTDSIASNDTIKTQLNTPEDCGYVSQSSTTSIRSMDSGVQRINDFYGRYDYRYRPVVRTSPKLNVNSSLDVKQKKEIDVRQFLQMWNEGDDENGDGHPNKEPTPSNSVDINYLSKQREAMNNQEQLYVLGSVNVPSEELSKYQHIQRVSKLPENIKGYTNIELLNQFEEVIESTSINSMKKFQLPLNGVVSKTNVMIPRPVSPLDVESKISQSVIHKEVGCNFEIKPCSPKMLNVEIAAPVHNILAERVIEKVTNPLSTIVNSPLLPRVEENVNDCKMSKRRKKIVNDTEEVSSCKMINTEFSTNNNDAIKSNYTVQDLESNLGVSLSSLPRLDSDIELNFPEVNQQFINANKVGNNNTTLIKDLPDLDEVNPTANITHIETLPAGDKIPEDCAIKNTNDKEFRKLSQYRKTKVCDSEIQDERLKCTVVRTDSVIIKNPENSKMMNMIKCENSPINLTSQNQVTNINECHYDDSKMIVNEDAGNCSITEIALDFSVNKNNDSYLHNSESNSKSLRETPLQEDTLIRNNVLKDPDLFSNCDKNEAVEGRVISCTYTSICAEDDVKSIFEHLNQDVSLSTNLNKNVEIEKQAKVVSETESTERELSSDNLNIVMAKSDKTDETLTENEILPNDLINKKEEKIYLIDTNIDENIPLDKTLQDNNFIEDEKSGLDYGKVPDLFNDKKIYKNNNMELFTTDKNNDKKQLTLGSKCLEQICMETTFSKLTENKHKYEGVMSDNKFAVNKSVVTEDEKKNDLKIDTKLIQHQENLYIEQYLLKNETNVVECNEIDLGFAGNLQHEIIRNENLITEQTSSSGQICKDETILKKVQNSPSYNHDFHLSLVDNSTTEFETYKSTHHDAEMNLKITDYRNKLKYYGKKLYSPYIQKLLMFNEGPCSPLQPIDTVLNVNKLAENQISQVPTKQELTVGTTGAIFNFNKEQIDNILATNMNCHNECLNSKEYKNETILTKSPDFVISNKETQETDEYLDTSEAGLSSTVEIINSQECSNINSIQENVLTVSTNDNEEIILVGNIDRQGLFTSKTDESISTSINFNGTDIIAKSNENKISQEKSKNDPNTTNMDLVNLNKKNISLKRSMSDSAINQLRESTNSESFSFNWPFKRKKVSHIEHTDGSNEIAQKLCNILQNRRNSLSSIYNDENVSFCILIDDNCIITEEEEDEDQICYENYSEDCLEVDNKLITQEEITEVNKEETAYSEENSCRYSESFILESNQEKTTEESWVQDVAYVETIVSDDIAEDIVISARSSPKNIDFSDTEESSIYGSELSEHTEKVRHIYGDKMSSVDAHFVETLYNTPQMDVNKALFITRDSQIFNQGNRYYDTESLEKILSETNSHIETSAMEETTDPVFSSEAILCHQSPKNITIGEISIQEDSIEKTTLKSDEGKSKLLETAQDDKLHSCEASNDNVFSYKSKDVTTNYSTSSSPEVSSTTSEERNSSILLKITNYMGSITSQINEISVNAKSCCKFTEKNDYLQSDAVLNSTRPFITKAAQKYIPPLKESIHDLKVKLSLPHQSLMKLKQLKLSKDEPKFDKYKKNLLITPKKTKPKFEDVLKSIDEIQFRKHKENHKKNKKYIPKVIIKKNENGSHYASPSNQDTYNPDLTGRKWQPWVFLEKNHFIDRMALKNKTKAVFSYRKKSYVLAEKFCKYKAVSTKFFISQPKFNDSSTGQLKYTIRLKHNY